MPHGQVRERCPWLQLTQRDLAAASASRQDLVVRRKCQSMPAVVRIGFVKHGNARRRPNSRILNRLHVVQRNSSTPLGHREAQPTSVVLVYRGCAGTRVG